MLTVGKNFYPSTRPNAHILTESFLWYHRPRLSDQIAIGVSFNSSIKTIFLVLFAALKHSVSLRYLPPSLYSNKLKFSQRLKTYKSLDKFDRVRKSSI